MASGELTDGKRSAEHNDPAAKRARAASPPFSWHDLGGRDANPPQLENDLIFATDWASTELGPLDSWPSEVLSHLWTSVVNSNFACCLLLGPEYRLVYNKAYATVIERKHPWAMGQPLFQVFPEVEPHLGPLYKRILSQREFFSLRSILVPLELDGTCLEEHYFDVNYSSLDIAVNQGSGANHASSVGISATLIETTHHVIAQRRLAVVSEISRCDGISFLLFVLLNLSATNDPKSIARQCLSIIAKNKMDFPASAIYLCSPSGVLSLESAVGFDITSGFTLPDSVDASASSNNPSADLAAQIYASVVSRKMHAVEQLMDTAGRIAHVDGNACKLAQIIPLVTASKDQVHGILLVCHNTLASPTNSDYISVLETTAASISSSIGVSKTVAEGVQRTEEQRRLNEAKTTFFHNISHEFRTPLTLMLGPLEEVLDTRRSATLERDVHLQLGFVYRNACRLLRLVNQLLDFSRVEAGRQKASFVPVDLALITADLASVFRAACAKANLELVVECAALAQPVYVDADMWEQIVLNLLSNAHKFTARGRITVRQTNSSDGSSVVLQVTDTGCGILKAEIPRLFQRFHQIKSAESRSHEGSGIGLALVAELVQLHGGKIQVESTENVGTTISVSIPFGKAHLKVTDVMETGVIADPAKASSKARQLASAWLLEQENVTTATSGSSENLDLLLGNETKGAVLVVDDNADMLYYVSRILKSSGFGVQTASNGQEALGLLTPGTSIDLILSDVMMPRLDGFGLLREIRSNQLTRHLPVIFLSARAGDEAKVEGIEAGADDYLVKPFTARELVARVTGKVHTRRLQQQVDAQERRLREVAEETNAAKDRFLAVLSHELRTPLTPALLLVEEMQADLENSHLVRENCGVIMRNILLEVQLIDDLLDIAKIEQQKLRLHLKCLSAHSLLVQALSLVQQSIDQKKQSVFLDLRATNAVVLADPIRLQQIFWNLIRNASKFTPQNGVLTLRSANEFDSVAKCEVLRVEVQDTGMGIEPEYLTAIFSAFEQGRESITRLFGGLGLGLSIAGSLAKMHNGELKATSEGKDKGACFVLTLPVASLMDASNLALVAPQAVTKSTSNSTPVRILLVEDNASTLLILTRALKRMGHFVETATNIKEAVAKAEADYFKFDVLVSDLSLPDGSGLSLPAVLQTRQPNLHAIAITGNGSAEDRARSQEAGFAVHLTKPIRLAELKEAMAQKIT